MSHELTIRKDGSVEMFSGQNIVPWHGLGTIVPNTVRAREAIHLAKLDWNVIKMPVFCNGKQVEGKQGICREDTGDCLEILGRRYEVIQNSEAFDFFDDVIGQGQAVYDTAGSLSGGKRIWIMAKLNGNLFIDNRPNDIIEKNVLLCSSHDGTSSLMMQIVSTRVVCANTLSMALGDCSNQIKIRHTKSYQSKKDAAKQALNLCNAYYDNLQRLLDKLEEIPMNQAEMDVFTEKLIPSEHKEGKISTRTMNIRNEISTLFSRGKGNLGRTRFDALNAVTEYVDHNRSTRTSESNSQEKRFESSMFGSGYSLKGKAVNLLAV